MENVRLSRSLCQTVGDVLSDTGSHATLEALFHSAGAPGDPPDLAHHSKWKEWLFRAGQDREVDSLAVLGNVLEEFMDIAPEASGGSPEDWRVQRTRVVASLEENGLRYFRFGRVLPQGQGGVSPEVTAPGDGPTGKDPEKPTNHLEVVQILVSGLRRAMHPLANRRKNASTLTFSNEYDVQDLLHALLRPWVNDIRPEEHTPSYAGSSARMGFLLPAYNLALELKFVRDRPHATRIGDELTIDIAHYLKHPECETLWCVVYDPNQHLQNPQGLCSDVGGEHRSEDGALVAKVIVL